MINRESRPVTEEKKFLVSVICDRCKKEYFPEDVLELQEFHHIYVQGGYASKFGDGSNVECDLCQHCLYELIKDFYREM